MATSLEAAFGQVFTIDCAGTFVSKRGLKSGAKSTPTLSIRKTTRQIQGCRKRVIVSAQAQGKQEREVKGPAPEVIIDNKSDPFATIVKISYSNKLGELLDTIQSLRDLGLNIRKAQLADQNQENVKATKLFLTEAQTSEKIIKSHRLEEIRLSVLNNLLYYHPESADQLAWDNTLGQHTTSTFTEGQFLGVRPTPKVRTTVTIRPGVEKVNSQLKIVTQDRPGLLVDIVDILKNLNVNVVSAEVDTVGEEARDEFFITYHGMALEQSMELLVINVMQYHLQHLDDENDADESY